MPIKTHKLTCASRPGFVTFTASLFLSLLIFYSLVYVSLVGRTSKQARIIEETIIAQAIAQAALQQSLWRLNTDPSYSGELAQNFSSGQYDIKLKVLDPEHINVTSRAYVPDKNSPRVQRSARFTAALDTTVGSPTEGQWLFVPGTYTSP